MTRLGATRPRRWSACTASLVGIELAKSPCERANQLLAGAIDGVSPVGTSWLTHVAADPRPASITHRRTRRRAAALVQPSQPGSEYLAVECQCTGCERNHAVGMGPRSESSLTTRVPTPDLRRLRTATCGRVAARRVSNWRQTSECAQRLCTTATIKPITKPASATKNTHLISVGMIFLSSTASTTGTDTAT